MRNIILIALTIALSIIAGCTIAVYAIELTPTPEPTSTIPPLPTMTSPFDPMARFYYIPAAFGASPCDDRLWGDLCGGAD